MTTKKIVPDFSPQRRAAFQAGFEEWNRWCWGLALMNPREQASTLNIAALLCLSGECFEWGHNSLKGIKLAVKELNTDQAHIDAASCARD